MAYNEKLANRIRGSLSEIPKVEEKEMMGGLTFMVNEKMCIGIIKDEMMCRIDPILHEIEINKGDDLLKTVIKMVNEIFSKIKTN